jgi:regulator of sirC expression with transglutaminase-like and TPR domain
MPPLPNFCNAEAYEQFLQCTENIESNEGLLGGAIAISRHFLDSSRCESVGWNLSGYSDQVLERVSGRSNDAKLAHLHDVLFDEAGFQGNTSNYYSVDNSLLPVVLESRMGIPITLALVYKIVAEEVGLKVDGINSPGHFLARVQLDGSDTMLVDPFQGGRILTESEALELVSGVSEHDPSDAKQLLPMCTHRQWLARILNNLHVVLLNESRFDDVSAMRELLVALLES